ncbi:MAG: THUMP domain-containing class I SAM-dependent RNA methyltransferase [Gemmatimonadaceae bacterium]
MTTRKYMPDSLTDLFAVTAPGLEALAARELLAMGATNCVATRGGVEWKGGARDLYSANLWLRTVSRVLVRVSQFHAATFYELERRAKRVPWRDFVGAGRGVRFLVTCHKSALYHSDAVAERLIRSVTAATGAASGKALMASASKSAETGEMGEEDDEPDNGAQLFVVRIDHDTVNISVDSSGALLHRRGYRQSIAKAPVRETLAAAMLMSSGWDPNTPLVDPMCGAGTIPIEAALMARRIAPGIRRSFAIERWPGFDAKVWEELRVAAREGELARAPSPIVASDRDAGGVQAAIDNAVRAGVAADVQVLNRPLSAAEPVGQPPGWIMTNPPYGIRVGTDLRNLYARLGTLTRKEFQGWRLGMLSAAPALDRQLGVPLEQVFETRNGGIKIRFMVTGGR